MNPYGQAAGVTAEDQGAIGAYDASGNPTGATNPADMPNATTGASYSGAADANTTLAQFLGFFNIMVGLMLVAGLLLFFAGFIAYLTRLGLESRIQGLSYMYYGLTVLFVLIVLLGLVHYLQFNPAIIFTIVAALVVVFGGWAAVKAFQEAGHGDEEGDH